MGLSNVFFMAGEDRFTLLQELRRWRDGFIEKHGGTDYEEWDGENGNVDQLRTALLSIPLFSEKRFILAKNLLEQAKADGMEALLESLEKVPESSIVVFAELSEPDKRTSAYKKLSTLATQRLFVKPKGAQLTLWVQRRAEFHGAVMDASAASRLIGLVGDDGFALDHEILKLALYTRGKAIRTQAVDELIQGQIQESIFALTDALAKKDFATAFKLLKELEEREEAGFLFSMIVRQFRLLLEIKSLAEKGQPAPMIARNMGVHPFVVQSSLRYSKNFTHSQLFHFLEQFLVIDRRLKNGLLPLKPREEDHFFLAMERILLKS